MFAELKSQRFGFQKENHKIVLMEEKTGIMGSRRRLTDLNGSDEKCVKSHIVTKAIKVIKNKLNNEI